MNENEKKTSDWKMIIGGIALIAVLFVVLTVVDIPVMEMWETAFFIPTRR